MSKYEIVRSLKREIKKINYIIDQRIIAGVPYANEARRHKFLMSQLNRLEPQRTGVFARVATAMSLFIF